MAARRVVLSEFRLLKRGCSAKSEPRRWTSSLDIDDVVQARGMPGKMAGMALAEGVLKP